MYVLGLTGWDKRSHDASACLVKDGKIIAAAEEERFTRRKRAYDSLPYSSARFCLDFEGIGLDDVDYVAVGWDMPYTHEIRGIRWPYKNAGLADVFFPKKYFTRTRQPRIEFVYHHRSHAASAYRCSGFSKSAILVADGQGEDTSTTIWLGEGDEIKFIRKMPVDCSLGYFYEALTEFCGFRPQDAGKLMGLSAYGRIAYHLDSAFSLDTDGYSANFQAKDVVLGKDGILDEQDQVRDRWLAVFEKFLPRNSTSYGFNERSGKFERHPDIAQKYIDMAASGQSVIENLMLHLAEISMRLAGSKNLCIAGGVGLNCAANGKIVESCSADNLFIQPAANDAGCSIGAALEISAQLNHVHNERLENVYLGPGYSEGMIADILKSRGVRFEYLDPVEPTAADLIAKGRVIGWFQGRMEMGPRALGHRSIIADPRYMEMKDKVNRTVKFREPFRPFGPSILSESAGEYAMGCRDSPFMLLNFKVSDDKAGSLSAVTHVDGSTRPQTVKENGRYRNLLEELEMRTGVPAVLNTSLNRKDEPIACTPDDALECFYGSGMDYLILENMLVRK